VVWDGLVADDDHDRGLGCRIVQELLASPPMAASERV
jgi:hypothetical protein